MVKNWIFLQHSRTPSLQYSDIAGRKHFRQQGVYLFRSQFPKKQRLEESTVCNESVI